VVVFTPKPLTLELTSLEKLKLVFQKMMLVTPQLLLILSETMLEIVLDNAQIYSNQFLLKFYQQ
jgi:hypothetical protein